MARLDDGGRDDEGAQFLHGVLYPAEPLEGRQGEIKANAAALVTLEATVKPARTP